MKDRDKNGTFLPDNRPTEEPRLCACGCNGLTTIFRKKARKFISGHNSNVENPFKGKKHAQATKKLMSQKKIGLKPWNWDKLNLDSYGQLHQWVKRHRGKASICEFCKSTNIVEWANKSHKYKHELSDWLELCRKCHARYDSGEYYGAARRIYG